MCNLSFAFSLKLPFLLFFILFYSLFFIFDAAQYFRILNVPLNL